MATEFAQNNVDNKRDITKAEYEIGYGSCAGDGMSTADKNLNGVKNVLDNRKLDGIEAEDIMQGAFIKGKNFPFAQVPEVQDSDLLMARRPDVPGAIDNDSDTHIKTTVSDFMVSGPVAEALTTQINELTRPTTKSKLYVDTVNGDDNNDGGSESTPFKTLNAAKLIEKVQETDQNQAAELELYAVGDIVDGLISYSQRVILKKVNTDTIKIKSDSKQGLSVFSDLKIDDSFQWENGESGALVGSGNFPFLKIDTKASVQIEADQDFFGNDGDPISCEGSLNIKNSTINLYEQSSGIDQLENFFRFRSGRFLNEGVKFEQKTDISLSGAVFFCGEYSFLENRSSSANGTTDYTQSTFTISNIGIFADNSRINKGGVTFQPSALVNDEDEEVGNLIR